tara:strand:- start:1206 stop:1970 length:765 start_codon:yes stop_codon:yes gene_type:complete
MGLTRSLADLSSIVTTNLSNGFVGIGSTIPTQKLDVVGVTTIGSGSTSSFTSSGTTLASAPSVLNYDGSQSFNLTSDISATKFIGISSGLSGIGITGIAIFQDSKAYNVNGGTFTNGAWRDRDLNEEVGSNNIGATLSSNKFTLKPGVYQIEWWATAYYVRTSISRLYNVTDDEVLTGVGGTVQINQQTYNWNGNGGTDRLHGSTPKITLNTDTEIKLQHQCLTTRTSYGFGYRSGWSAFGDNHYTYVVIHKSG